MIYWGAVVDSNWRLSKVAMNSQSGKPLNFAAKETHKQPSLTPPPVESEVDDYLRRLASSGERPVADGRLPRVVQLSSVDGLSRMDGMARAEKILRASEPSSEGGRFPPSLEPERLPPPPAMRRGRAGLSASLWVVIVCAVAAPIAYHYLAGSLVPASESGRGSKLASLNSRIEVTASTAAALSPNAAPPQSTISAQKPDSPLAPTHSSSSSRGETTAMLAPSPSAAETLRGSNATRRLEPEDIKLLMKQGGQFAAASDLPSARLAFRRAAEAGDATAALAMGATYDPIMLEKLGFRGVIADVGKARSWYEKAEELGSPEASHRLELLANR